MLSDLETKIIASLSLAEYQMLSPVKMPNTEIYYDMHNWFNASLKRMRFGRRALFYTVTKSTGFSVKDMVFDLQISDVAVRDMIKHCMENEYITNDSLTNRYRMTDGVCRQYLRYAKSVMKKERKILQEMTNLFVTLDTLDSTKN